MRIEVYEQRVLVPEEGYYLYNAEAGAISDKVYLGKQASPDAWVEITEEEKLRIEEEERFRIEGYVSEPETETMGETEEPKTEAE